MSDLCVNHIVVFTTRRLISQNVAHTSLVIHDKAHMTIEED